MKTYKLEKRVKIVKFYYSTCGSFISSQRKYRQHFNTRTAPTVSMIKNLIIRFEERGSVDNYPRSNICCPVRHEESVQAVRQSVSDDLSVSTRQLAVQLNMSRTSLKRILKMDLKMFPYIIWHIRYKWARIITSRSSATATVC